MDVVMPIIVTRNEIIPMAVKAIESIRRTADVNLIIVEGSSYFEDYAEELFDECHAHTVPNNLKNYIDYKSFASDLEMDYSAVEYKGITFYWREA